MWTAANINLGIDMGEVREFINLVWSAWNMKQWSVQELARLFTIAWGIRFNRNEVWVGGARKMASGIAGWTLEYLEEFQVVNHHIKVENPEVEVGWVLPQHPWLKVNVDGAVFERQ